MWKIHTSVVDWSPVQVFLLHTRFCLRVRWFLATLYKDHHKHHYKDDSTKDSLCGHVPLLTISESFCLLGRDDRDRRNRCRGRSGLWRRHVGCWTRGLVAKCGAGNRVSAHLQCHCVDVGLRVVLELCVVIIEESAAKHDVKWLILACLQIIDEYLAHGRHS